MRFRVVNEALDSIESRIHNMIEGQLREASLQLLEEIKMELTQETIEDVMQQEASHRDLSLKPLSLGFKYKVAALEALLELNQEGVIDDEKAIQKIEDIKKGKSLVMDSLRKAESQAFEEKREEKLSMILAELIHQINTIEEVDKDNLVDRWARIEATSRSYELEGIYLDKIESQLANLKYLLMIEALKKGDIVIAQKLMTSFDSQMEVEISKKSGALYEKIKQSNLTTDTLEARHTLFEYIYDQKGDAKSLALWRALLIAEAPDINPDIIEALRQAESVVEESKSVIEKQTEEKKDIRKMMEEDKGEYEVIYIKYDPKYASTGGISPKEEKKLRNLYHTTDKKSSKKISLYFDDRITIIPDFMPATLDLPSQVLADLNIARVEKVTLPKNLKEIGDNFMRGASSLSTLNVEEGVEKIGKSFCSETGVTAFRIPTTVKSVGDCFFQNASCLTKVTAEKGPETFGDCCFHGCTSLTDLQIGEGTKTFGSHFCRACRTITSFYVPTTAESLGEYFFSGATNLQSVIMKKGPEVIGEYGFAGCTALTDLQIGEGTKTFESHFGTGCRSITSFHLPTTTEYIGGYFFEGATGLQSVVMEKGPKTIKSYCFQGCTSLTDLQIGEGTKTIESHFGRFCPSITSFRVPTTVERIGDYFFEGATGLQSVIMERGPETIGSYCFEGCTALADLQIGEGTKTFGDFFCNGNRLMTSFRVPITTQTLGKCFFLNATGLQKVIMEKGPETFRDCCFQGCTSLTELQIGEGTRHIGNNFCNCATSLKSFSLPNSVEDLGDFFMANTASLIQVQMPHGPEVIGAGAFENATALQILDIGEGTEVIGNDFCKGADSLRVVRTPSTLNSTGSNFLSNMQSLQQIIMGEQVSQTSGDFLQFNPNLVSAVLKNYELLVPGNGVNPYDVGMLLKKNEVQRMFDTSTGKDTEVQNYRIEPWNANFPFCIAVLSKRTLKILNQTQMGLDYRVSSDSDSKKKEIGDKIKKAFSQKQENEEEMVLYRVKSNHYSGGGIGIVRVNGRDYEKFTPEAILENLEAGENDQSLYIFIPRSMTRTLALEFNGSESLPFSEVTIQKNPELGIFDDKVSTPDITNNETGKKTNPDPTDDDTDR